MRLDINILGPHSLSIRLHMSHFSTKWAQCERTINFSFIASLTTFISHNLPLLAAVFCGVFLRVPRRPSGSGPAGYSSRATTSLCSPSVSCNDVNLSLSDARFCLFRSLGYSYRQSQFLLCVNSTIDYTQRIFNQTERRWISCVSKASAVYIGICSYSIFVNVYNRDTTFIKYCAIFFKCTYVYSVLQLLFPFLYYFLFFLLVKLGAL